MIHARTVMAVTPALSLVAFAGSASAQWLSYTNMTTTKLTLSTVSANDNQEKDIAKADFDKDGWDDLVVVRKEPFSNPGPRQDLLLMNEQGTLVDRTAQYAPGFLVNFTDARDVLCRDFTGDGWIDIVICTTFDNPPRFYVNQGNNGSGQWLGLADESARIGPLSPSPFRMCGVNAGDIDNDGDLDMYWANYNGGDDMLLVNDGAGNFTDQTASRVGNYANVAFGTGVEMGDFDQDGDVDILKISTLFSAPPFSGGCYILWNDGTGKFNSMPFQQLTPTTSAYMFAAADFSGDGVTDFYIVQDPQDRVLVSTIVGPHNLSWIDKQVSGSRTDGFGGNVRVADLDRDGDLDFGIAPIDVDIKNCGAGAQFALLQNDGTGKLTDVMPANMNINVDCHDFEFIDINRDGCLDIFMGMCTGWRVFIADNCSCYADCDFSGSLDVFDFLCFQDQFNISQPYSDCDGSGGLDFFDFICFVDKFNAGCP